MKNKTNQITIIYILASIFLAITYREVLKHVSIDHSSFSFINDILFILVSGILLKYVLYKNDIKNSEIYKKLKGEWLLMFLLKYFVLIILYLVLFKLYNTRKGKVYLNVANLVLDL